MIRWTTGSELFPIPTVDLINRFSLFDVNMS